MAEGLITWLASDVLAGFVRFAFRFIRTKTAEKLQDGDLTDQKFRGWILRELDDIKSKVDSMSRKDLGASVSFLQQGIKRLDMSVGEFSKSDCDGSPSTSELSAPQSVTLENAVALADAIGKLKIESNERFDLAKKSFQEASKQATLAFHNAGLSTEERILASKVRLASGILEHLEDPGMAASDCLQYLEELHDIPALKEIFSVHYQGGIRSLFKKDSRREMVETVTMINLILADFISKFTRQRMAVFDWPTIVCGEQVVHPIHFKKESLPNLSEQKITPPWDIVKLEDDRLCPSYKCALNKKADLVCFTKDPHVPQKLVKTTHELQPYCHPELGDNVTGIAVDEDDTVYVVTHHEKAGSSLSVYSADGRNTHQSALKFLRFPNCSRISFTNNKNIVIAESFQPREVHVCDRNGELINSFSPIENPAPNYSSVRSVSVSPNDEIVLVPVNVNIFSKVTYQLSTYTQDGKFQRTVKFRTSSDCSDLYKDIFYNHVTNTIIGYGRNSRDDKSFIEYVSAETGELQRSYVLYTTNFPEKVSNFRLVCHINGTMALVGERHVIYLQNPSAST